MKHFLLHIAIIVASLVILNVTLFIPQYADKNRKVHLGYPLHFYVLDFSGEKGSTHMSGAPEGYVETQKFNILNSWEEFGEVDHGNRIISFTIILLILEIAVFIKSKFFSHRQSLIRNI